MPWLAALLDLVFPRRCVGCGGVGASFCRLCMPSGDLVRVGSGALATVAAASYSDAVRAALIAYKERGRRDLGRPLGALLTGAVSGLLEFNRTPSAPVVLVAVPSSRGAAAARGGDHVARLVRRVAVSIGIRCATGALSLVRGVQDSAGLSSAERAANLGGAMTARLAPPGCTAVLIDDIVTTGATLREARRALVESGWPVIGAAVVAATPRLDGNGRVPATPLAVSRSSV